jgi:ubiquitin-conjugating enzyme E2 Z
MDFSRKRIMADMKNLQKNPELKKCGIHVIFNDDTLYNAQAMIIGPEKTPYEKGFYFFDINFPSDYPMNPPKVKFCTLDGRVRFNPNLYACGKVCLSIIGTWSGPGWTSCLTLSTVLVSIQSLLNENPITNEPGFEKEPITGNTSKTYNDIIAYENIRVAVIKMFEHTPFLFIGFKDIMKQYFVENIDFYEKFVDNHELLHNKVYSSRIYSMNGNYDINNLKKSLIRIKSSNVFDNIQINDNIQTQGNHTQNTLESNNENAKKQKKTPNENANNFDIGIIVTSSNDLRDYVVKQMSFNKKDKNGELNKVEFKKWVLKK